jgi:hypothetical protein
VVQNLFNIHLNQLKFPLTVDLLYLVCFVLFLIIKELFLFSLALPLRSVHQQNTYAKNLAIVLGVIGFLAIFIFIGIGLCYHKSSQSGHYKTKEDLGADQALDADTAIIKGDPRHPDLTEAKEWFF